MTEIKRWIGRDRRGAGRLVPAPLLGSGFPPPHRSSFACMHEDELIRLTNHHSSAAPVIEERAGRYLGYFENKFGEQLVFVHDDGEADATVFLGDVDWEPRRVTDAGGLPDAGDLVLNDEECAFVNACWIATAWRREDARSCHAAA